MSTIQKEIESKLSDCILWDDEIAQIIAIAKQDKTLANVKWNDAKEGYPVQFLAALWMNVKSIALDWVNKNAPNHIAKNMLEG